MNWHLAELNIAKMKFEPDGSEMQDFNDALDPVNALGEDCEKMVRLPRLSVFPRRSRRLQHKVQL
jgi:hypothetical protein